MRRKYIVISILLLPLFGCSETTDEYTEPIPEGMVRIDPLLPRTYGYTRAEDLSPIPGRKPLPDGSTLWLTISKKDDQGDFITHTDPKPYIVIAKDAGYQSLYPIGIDKNNNDNDLIAIDPDIVSSYPLYLEPGEYKFRMISPAKTLHKDGYKALVKNGEYFYATDDRYNQTKAEPVTVTIDPSGGSVQRVVLNPMINQTSRISIKLNKGTSVHTLEMYPSGIEISGIQTDLENTKFNWGSNNISDTLVMKLADKRGRTFIKDFTINDDGSIEASTGILPTNAQGNSVVLLFTVKVNGIPTQLQAVLNNMIFKHAHSYNFVFDVDIDGGITVATPIHNSWTIIEYI